MTRARPPRQKPNANSLPQIRGQAEALMERTLLPISELDVHDWQKLVHELQTHQMELVIQNEELQRVQLELETARDRYAALYDSAPVGYVTLDAAGVIRQANLTAALLLGVERRHLTGRKFTRFIAPAAQDIYYLHQQKVMTSGGKETCELQLLRRNGANFTAELHSVILQDEPNGPGKYFIALSDVTERLRSEAERAGLAAIVESSNDAIISRTLDGAITSWNQGAEQIFGYSAREIVGRPFSLLVPPDQLATSRQIQQRIEQGELVGHYGAERFAKDGRRIIVSVSSSPVKDANGRIMGISAVMRDITRQKEAEEALRQSERSLADFFAESPLGLLWVGPNGRVLRVNQAQLELLGCAQDEVTGHFVSEFHADPEVAVELLCRLAEKETVQNHRARLRSRDGAIRHVLIDANGLWEGAQLVHYRWFVRDVTRRRELEREILAIAEREQRRIGRDLHDDLGQQLAGIEFLTQTLTGQLKTISRSGAAQARKIARMVRDTMVHARELAHGLSPIGLEQDGLMVALGELAARTKKLFRLDCRFQCRTQIVIPDHEVGTHLYRIAQEAVSNAIKHGKATRINIGLGLSGDRILLAVSDNGIGLPKAPKRGNGLGLRVMQYRVGVIGGSLVVQRGVNGGTTVICSVGDPHAELSKGTKK